MFVGLVSVDSAPASVDSLLSDASVAASSVSVSPSAVGPVAFGPKLPVWAPPELCTAPVSESSSGESPAEVEVFGDEPEPVDVVDEVEVEVVVSVGVVVSDCSDVEFTDDVDEPDDEPVESASANAIPGVLATADPIPSATAKVPTRPMYLA